MDSTAIPNELNIPTNTEVTQQPVATLPPPVYTQDWAKGNVQYGYNMGHIYGTFDINLQAFLAWSRGPKDTNFVPDPVSNLKIYVTKADTSKKVVSVIVRTGKTDRLVKMFEPMSSHFISVLQNQLIDIQQNLVNLLDASQVPAIVRVPLSANGPIEDSMFNNKRQTELKAIGYSTEIKSENDAVFSNTVYAHIRFLLSQRQV